MCSREQVRRAGGFEHWTPGSEDIKALKTAEKLMRDGVFEDLRGQGRNENEPQAPDITFDDPKAGDILFHSDADMMPPVALSGNDALAQVMPPREQTAHGDDALMTTG